MLPARFRSQTGTSNFRSQVSFFLVFLCSFQGALRPACSAFAGPQVSCLRYSSVLGIQPCASLGRLSRLRLTLAGSLLPVLRFTYSAIPQNDTVKSLQSDRQSRSALLDFIGFAFRLTVLFALLERSCRSFRLLTLSSVVSFGLLMFRPRI